MSELNKIDYNPLLAMNGAWQLILRQTITLWGLGLVVAFVVVSLAGSMFLAFDLAIVIVILYGVVISTKVRKLKDTMWWQFAAANGWRLDTETPPGVIIPPSLQFGHDQIWSPIIQAQFGELTCDMLTYHCITGYGKSEQTHNFTLACVSLPQILPHMLLLSKKFRADLQRDIGDGESLQLEGDFGDYFTMQIEKGQAVNVLTIITPDVMQTLVAYNQNEDIEILGRNLYFITNRDKRDYRDMQLIVRSIVELGQQIADNASKVKLAAAPQPTANS